MDIQYIEFNPESMILRSPKAFREYCQQFYSRPCFKQFKNPDGFAPSPALSSGVVGQGASL